MYNARLLAGCPAAFPIVVAGNRSCAAEVMRLLSGRDACAVENVMPKLNVLNILPAQAKIRALFLERIVRAKGLSRQARLLDGIIMPTPAAVMTALELLAGGTKAVPGLGELIAVDVGGATTDVYSIAAGLPRQSNVLYKGLPEPFAKRTVEGDIGMRYSARGVVEAATADEVAALAGLTSARVTELAAYLGEHPGAGSAGKSADTAKKGTAASGPPGAAELAALDHALACHAVDTATQRHAGTLEQVYTVSGVAFAQTGKDLTDTGRLVLTGGALAHAAPRRLRDIAAHALYSNKQPASLRPQKADVLTDRRYILAAMGLLAGIDPDCALTLIKKELAYDGTVQQEA